MIPVPAIQLFRSWTQTNQGNRHPFDSRSQNMKQKVLIIAPSRFRAELAAEWIGLNPCDVKAITFEDQIYGLDRAVKMLSLEPCDLEDLALRRGHFVMRLDDSPIRNYMESRAASATT